MNYVNKSRPALPENEMSTSTGSRYDRQRPVHIQGELPYECLDPVRQEWMNRIRLRWFAWRKSVAVSNILHEFFQIFENPYETALMAMVNSGDFYDSKQGSLSYHIMECFAHWKVSNGSKLPQLTPKLKLDAFCLVTKQKNLGLTKLVAEIFEMKTDKHIFWDSINNMAKRNFYKEACQCAAMLELHSDFGVEEFIIPLIFQDKFMIAQEFLNGSKSFQFKTAQFLDNILGAKNMRAEVKRIVRTLAIFDPKMDKVCGKPLSKLLKRLITLYNIPLSKCPNLTKKAGSGALQFLLRKKYLEKSISEESWLELVEEAVSDDPDLQLELVSRVAIFGDEAEAIRWADKYNIPSHLRPHSIQSGSTRRPAEVKPESDDKAHNLDIFEDQASVRFHQIKLPEESIHIIDNLIDFNNFLESSLNGVFICGIDCEWKPPMSLKKCKLALIQIATLEAVYIIDVVTLVPLVSDSVWDSFVSRVFTNNELLKIGFGFEGDSGVMQDTIPSFRGLKPTGPGYLDLHRLWRILINSYNFEFPFSGDAESSANSESLNRLVELSLGKKLDKSNQFSNWERRPLRRSQILYAALDAYCLLEIYDVLRAAAEKQNIPLLEIISNLMGEKETNQKVKKKARANTLQ